MILTIKRLFFKEKKKIIKLIIAIVFGMIVFIQPFEIGIFEKDSIVAANISIKADSYVWKYKKINGIDIFRSCQYRDYI